MAREGILRITRALFALILAAATATNAWTIYVDDTAPAGGDGTSWATAHRFLQDALATAAEGDEVRVGPGVYKPDRDEANPEGTRDRAATFEVGDGVTLKGGFAGLGAEDPNAFDTALYTCVLSGDLNGDDEPVSDPCDLKDASSRLDNVYHVVRLTGGVLEAVEVTAGYAHRRVVLNPYTVAFTSDHAGGGIRGYGAVRDCLICGNYAEELGGGLWYRGSSTINVQQCRFIGNATRGWGGGMCFMECEATLRDCEIQGNRAGRKGGGGHSSDSDVVISSCRIWENEAGSGGGICIDSGRLSSQDSYFVANTANHGSGGVLGKGDLQFVQCHFTSNSATSRGGGMGIAYGSSVRIAGCVFGGNLSEEAGGALATSGQMDLTNCVAWQNRAPAGTFLEAILNPYDDTQVAVKGCIISNDGREIRSNRTGVTLRYSNVVSGLEFLSDAASGISIESGNIETDPCFADPGYWDDSDTPDDPNDDVYIPGDYHLKSQAGRWDPATVSWVQDEVTSPCIDAGDPNSDVGYEPLPDGGRINMGVYGGTLEASKSIVSEPEVSRGERYQQLLDCLVLFADETPRVLWSGGYIFQLLPRWDSYFVVPDVDPNDPNAVVTAFLEMWSDLFMAPSGAVSFGISRTKTYESPARSFVTFYQTYAGLTVYVADIIVKTNGDEGITYVSSNIMTSTAILDARPDLLRPSLGGVTAQHLAEAYRNEWSLRSTCVASIPSLMIYDPRVLHKSGAPCLVWRMDVAPINSLLGYEVLVDAHTGDIVFEVPLFR